MPPAAEVQSPNHSPPGKSLLLIFNIIPSWYENIISMTWVLPNLLWLNFWSRIWPILINVPCILEKNLYSALVECNVLHVSIMSHWLIVLSSSIIYLLIFSLLVLSVTESRELKSWTIIEDLCFTLQFLQFLFHRFEILLLRASMFNSCILLMNWLVVHMRWSLSLIVFFDVNYALSYIKIAILTFFELIAWTWWVLPCLVLDIFCLPIHIIEFCYQIQFSFLETVGSFWSCFYILLGRSGTVLIWG